MCQKNYQDQTRSSFDSLSDVNVRDTLKEKETEKRETEGKEIEQHDWRVFRRRTKKN